MEIPESMHILTSSFRKNLRHSTPNMKLPIHSLSKLRLPLAILPCLLATSMVHAALLSAHIDNFIPISTDPSFFNPDLVSASNITNSPSGSAYTYSSASLFCLNPGLSGYAPGSTVVFNTMPYSSALYETGLTTPQQDQATAYTHWLVDNYYNGWVMNPGAISNTLRQDRAQAFENVLREITVDWHGSNSDLNGYAGSNDFRFLTMSDPTVATDLLGYVLASGVSSSYRSSSYYIDTYQYAANPASPGGGGAGQGQNMLAVAPAPVPEPSGAFLLVLTGTMIRLRRKR